MKRPIALNRTASEAVWILAAQIRQARHHKGWTAADLGARIGVTAKTISAIESGRPGVAVGTVLNAAAVTGVPLFAAEGAELARLRRRGEESVALIPSRTYSPRTPEDTDDLDF